MAVVLEVALNNLLSKQTPAVQKDLQALAEGLKRLEAEAKDNVDAAVQLDMVYNKLSKTLNQAAGQASPVTTAQRVAQGQKIAGEIGAMAAKKQAMEVRGLVSQLDDAAEASMDLVAAAKYAAAINILPRGYEMYTVRMTQMLVGLGKGAPVLAGVGLAAYSVGIQVSNMVRQNDPLIQKFTTSVNRFGVAWDEAGKRMGASSLVRGGVDGLTQSIENLVEIMNEGYPTIKGTLALLMGDEGGARSAGGEIAKRRAELDAAMERFNLGRARGVMGEVDSGRAYSAFGTGAKISGATNRDELAALEKNIRDNFEGTFPSLTEDEKKQSEVTFRREMLAIETKRRELLMREVELKTALKKIDDAAAGVKAKEDELETVQQVNKELAKQKQEVEALAKAGKLSADEQEKRLRTLTELVRRKGEIERLDLEYIAELEAEQWQGKLNGWKIEEGFRQRRMEAEKAFMDAQKKFLDDQVSKRKQALGGEEGVAGAIQQLDPRAVRQRIADNRLRSADDKMRENFARQRAQFKEQWDGQDQRVDPRTGRVVTRDQAFNQLLRQQAKQREANRQSVRAGAFRDFNSGRVGAEEMQRGQFDTMRGVVDAQEASGRTSEETIRAMREILDTAQSNAQANAMLQQEVAMIRQDNAIIQQQLNGNAQAANARQQRARAQRAGNPR